MAKWLEHLDDPNLRSRLIELKKVCFVINREISRLKIEKSSVGEIKKLMAERLIWKKCHKNIERAYIYCYRENLRQEREYRKNKVLVEEFLNFRKNKK